MAGAAPSTNMSINSEEKLDLMAREVDDMYQKQERREQLFDKMAAFFERDEKEQKKIAHVKTYIPRVSKTQLTIERRWLTELVRSLFAECLGTMFPTMLAIIGGMNYPDDQLTQAFGILLAVALALTISIPISGGHINPAYTVAFAATRGFAWRRVLAYYIFQLFGTILSGLVSWLWLLEEINAKEVEWAEKGLDMCGYGGPLSVFVAVPNPATPFAILVTWEVISTMIQSIWIWMVMVKFHNWFPAPVQGGMVAMGVMLCVLMSKGKVIAMNPARDMGPRMVASWRYGVCAWQHYALIPAIFTPITTTFTFFVMDFLFGNYTLQIKAGLAKQKDEPDQRVSTGVQNDGQAEGTGIDLEAQAGRPERRGFMGMLRKVRSATKERNMELRPTTRLPIPSAADRIGHMGEQASPIFN